MLYRIFNGYARQFSNGQEPPALNYNGDAVLSIDPSKTNCALVVGDPEGYIISIVEMSGNNWSRGPVDDTTVFVSELKEFIHKYLQGVNVIKVGLEKAITKRGMNHHHSNMVLTEIRGALLNLFWEDYHFKESDVEVNNWSWKHAILPEGYRSQSEKGSKRYFREYLQDNTYEDYYEADVTDCLCIYQYIIRSIKDTYKIACTKSEQLGEKVNIAIFPEWADQLNYRSFDYNPSFSLEENGAYFANRSKVHGIAKVDVNFLRLVDIYTRACGFSEIPKGGEVRVIVQV